MSAGVVARWAGQAHNRGDLVCPDCGETVAAGANCPGCYQLAPAPAGMLAAVIDTPAGARLVVAERTPTGGWAPVRAVPATGETVRMVRRQRTLPPAADAGGGLL